MGLIDIPPQYIAIGFCLWLVGSIFFIWRSELIASSVFTFFFFGQVLLDIALKGRAIPNGQLTIVLFGPLLLFSVAFRQRSPVIFKNVLLFVLMAFMVVFSMIWNNVSFLKYKSVLLPIMVALIIYLSISDLKALKTVLIIFVLFMVINNIVAGLQYAGFERFYLPTQLELKEASGFKRGPGLMNHFWQTGLISAAAIPIAVMSVISSRQPWKRLCWLGIVLSGASGLLFSALRAGFGGAVFGSFLALFLWNARRALPIIMGGLLLLCLLVLAVPIFRTSSNALLTHATTIDNSVMMRPILAAEGLALWQTSPLFGVGPKGVSRLFNNGKGGNAHNSYIAELSDYGLVGLGVFLTILIVPIVRLKAAIRRLPHHRPLLYGLMGSLVSIYLVAVVHSVEDIPQFWMFPALALAVDRIRAGDPRPRPQLIRPEGSPLVAANYRGPYAVGKPRPTC